MNQGEPEIMTLRREAHAAFDQLWKRKVVSRDTAYEKLALLLGKKREDAHFKFLTREECRRVLHMIGGMTVPTIRDRSRMQSRAVAARRDGRRRRAAIESMRQREREEHS